MGNLSEIKGLDVQIQDNGITDADKLNGFEWSGSIVIRCNSIRDFYNAWSEWRMGCGQNGLSATYVPLSKWKGQWLFYSNGRLAHLWFPPNATTTEAAPLSAGFGGRGFPP